MTGPEPVVYIVITKVPPPGDDSNLSDDIAYYFDFPESRGGRLLTILDEPPPDSAERMNRGEYAEVRTQVFTLGEIIIAKPEYEREYGPHGRKPSKWHVDYAIFDNVQDAIVKSREVRAGPKAYMPSIDDCLKNNSLIQNLDRHRQK